MTPTRFDHRSVMTVTTVHPTLVSRFPQATAPGTGFSLALDDEHLQIRHWVHDFAAV